MLQLHFTDEVEDTQNKKVSHISTHTRLPLKKKISEYNIGNNNQI